MRRRRRRAWEACVGKVRGKGKGREGNGGGRKGGPRVTTSVITFNGTAAMPGIPVVGDESLRGFDFGGRVMRCDFAASW